MSATPIKITNIENELTAAIVQREDGLFAVSFWDITEKFSLGFVRLTRELAAAETIARDYVNGRPGPISIRL